MNAHNGASRLDDITPCDQGGGAHTPGDVREHLGRDGHTRFGLFLEPDAKLGGLFFPNRRQEGIGRINVSLAGLSQVRLEISGPDTA